MTCVCQHWVFYFDTRWFLGLFENHWKPQHIHFKKTSIHPINIAINWVLTYANFLIFKHSHDCPWLCHWKRLRRDTTKIQGWFTPTLGQWKWCCFRISRVPSTSLKSISKSPQKTEKNPEKSLQKSPPTKTTPSQSHIFQPSSPSHPRHPHPHHPRAPSPGSYVRQRRDHPTQLRAVHRGRHGAQDDASRGAARSALLQVLDLTKVGSLE